MIDHAKEHLLSFGQAAKRLPRRSDESPVHPNTVARWTRAGIRGIVLETILIGNRRYTSIEACQRFFAALTTAASPPRFDSAEHDASTIEAMRKLEAVGI